MRRRYTLLPGALALSLVVAGCTSGGDAQGEILIGVTIEQSGPSAVLGMAELNAIRLVADDINKKGGVLGKRLKLDIKDNRSDANDAKRQVNEFIANERTVGIVGSGTTATTLPFADVVEQKRMPTITMAVADVIVKNRKFIFKTPPDGTKFVAVMFDDMASVGVKKVAALAVDDQFGDNGLIAVRAATQKRGVGITGIERFAAKETDFTAQVTRLVQGNPDAILVSAIMPAAGVAAKNIQQSGYQGRVYFDGGAGAELFVAGAGKSAEGMFMVHSSILAANQLTATTPSALAQKEFFTRYTQKHSTYSGYASYSADALSLMVEGIRQAKSTDREKVRDAIESLSFDGLTGSFQFGPTNHGGASGDGLTVLTVRKGGWILAQ